MLSVREFLLKNIFAADNPLKILRVCGLPVFWFQSLLVFGGPSGGLRGFFGCGQIAEIRFPAVCVF